MLAGPLLLFAVLTSPYRMRALAMSVVVLAMPLAHLGFRWRYYGDYMPNTAYLKLFGFGGRLKSGIAWTFKFYASYPVAGLLVGAAFLRIASRGCGGRLSSA